MERTKNVELAKLICELKKLSIERKVKIWKRIATDLEKPTRNRRIVNIYHINQNTKEGDVIIVPGKVLGTGDLDKKITVAAYNFSDDAYRKVKETGSALSIRDLIKKNPEGKKVRIIG